MTEHHVLRTKITPPRKTTRTLVRHRVSKALLEALNFRLTLLQAGAGYGKSTALAALVEDHQPLIWYQVTEEDTDSPLFLSHLLQATRLALPDIRGLPPHPLDSWDITRGPFPARDYVYQYLNVLSEGLVDPTLLVIDDVHLVVENPDIAHILDQLIGLAPPDLHILLAARPLLTLPNLARWRSRGDVLTLNQSILAFSPDEIMRLFDQHYDYEITAEEAERILSATEGWAITLHLIWQSLRRGGITSIEEDLARMDAPLESLFDVLAQDVLARQSEDVQHFLKVTATLQVMTPQACDALLELETRGGSSNSTAMLNFLRRQELFVVDVGDGGGEQSGLRYHHIFHHFLSQQSDAADRRNWHLRAAAYFRKQDEIESAIFHLFQGDELAQVAELMATYGEKLLESGRLDRLATYLDGLPPTALSRYPVLIFYLGDLARLHSRFQEALGWYQQAEAIWRESGQWDGVGRALRGQARVYLDTVDPSKAEDLLQQSLRLSDGTADRQAQARLYELLAENKLNAGKPEEAEKFQGQAVSLRIEGPSDSQLLFRVLLRTGRLVEARRQLEAQEEAEREEPVQTPRAHRETHLLLSLIYAFQGEAELAYQAAIVGTQRGVTLASPYVTAAGYMRQGHALMLLPGEGRYQEARGQFEKAIDISQALAVPRLRVEAYWGLCRVFGYRGDLANALDAAQGGIAIASQAGDEWIASLIRLAMGASYTLAARYESSSEWLNRARRGFEECSDPFGATVAKLWLCLGWFHQKDDDRLAQILPEVLAACKKHDYDFLFTCPTLLGVPNERVLVPMLILARDKGWDGIYPAHLLGQIGLPEITSHPGYQLRVYTLGRFQVWLGDNAVPGNGWRRATTRQLWQLMITHRHAPLDRDQIFEHLWPGVDPEVSQRNFKVALNTLYKVLEPNRSPGSDSAYILREGSVYGLRPSADLWLDAEIFSQSLQEAETSSESNPSEAIRLFEEGLAYYQGKYLPETRYETWAAAERERLAVLFLRGADHLCELYLQKGFLEEVITLAHRILVEDRCWERAYRHLMEAYGRMGDNGQVARSYRRCVQVLREDLDVSTSHETEMLYQKLTGKINTGN